MEDFTLNATNFTHGTYQLDRNGNITAGANNQSLLVSNPVKYSVTVSDSTCNNSLKSGSTRVSIPCLPPFDPQQNLESNNVNSYESQLSILYDAGVEMLNVNAGNLKGTNFTISIFDNTGKLIYKENGTVENFEILREVNCTSFSSG